jgi:hypothetical protein
MPPWSASTSIYPDLKLDRSSLFGDEVYGFQDYMSKNKSPHDIMGVSCETKLGHNKVSSI